jgi:hypothetical protein
MGKAHWTHSLKLSAQIHSNGESTLDYIGHSCVCGEIPRSNPFQWGKHIGPTRLVVGHWLKSLPMGKAHWALLDRPFKSLPTGKVHWAWHDIQSLPMGQIHWTTPTKTKHPSDGESTSDRLPPNNALPMGIPHRIRSKTNTLQVGTVHLGPADRCRHLSGEESTPDFVWKGVSLRACPNVP